MSVPGSVCPFFSLSDHISVHIADEEPTEANTSFLTVPTSRHHVEDSDFVFTQVELVRISHIRPDDFGSEPTFLFGSVRLSVCNNISASRELSAVLASTYC